MLDVIKGFFSTKGFMPHGMCLFWKPSVLWTLVVSNGLIALAYLLIPSILLFVYLKRKDVQYTWVFLLFAAFILFCGATHALHVVTYWNPIYGIQGLADALTALVSLTTAFVLWRLVPSLLELPTIEAFKASEAKYKTLVEAVQHGICTFDSDFKIKFVNQMGSQILSQPTNQLLGSDIRRIFDLTEDLLSVKQAHGECVIYTDNRQKIIDYYIGQSSKLSETKRFILSFSDITIFKDISNWDSNSDVIEQTKITRDRLIESQKLESLGQFAGGIAHDFNNSLAIIAGSLEVSRSFASSDNKELYHQLDVAEKAVSSSSELIKQLLTFSRSDHLECDRKNLRLHDILNKVRIFDKTILGAIIKCTIKEAKDLWPIHANENQLLQLFTNFMTNARDAMPDGGQLKIITENVIIDENTSKKSPSLKPGTYVKLTIKDTGTGIPKANLDKLFMPFFTTKPVGKGTGLGLSVIYGIVTNHGGEILVKSKMNKGTTFTIYFPSVSSEKEQQHATATQQTKANQVDWGLFKDKQVLIVDDEEALREIISIYFSSCDAIVHTASNGLEALDVFEKHANQLHLIILDTTMPKLDGISTYNEIRKKSKQLPIIFTSGNDSDSKLSKITNDDPNTIWLAKPFTKAELLENAHQLMI